MPPRIKPGELPKPMIRPDAIGCLPVNSFALSCVEAGYADAFIGFRDTESTLALKGKSTITATKEGKRTSIDLTGRFFNGLSDALYRGCLPQALWVTAGAAQWPELLKDFVEYLEKLSALGFFISKKVMANRDPVEELVPCLLLCGDGLLYSRVITGLMTILKDMEREHPAFNEETRLRIVGRILRILPAADETSAMTTLLAESTICVSSFPTRFRLAGGDRQSRQLVKEILKSRGLNTELEPSAAVSVERLELAGALWRVSSRILPALQASGQMDQAEIQSIASSVERGLLAIGVGRRVISASEDIKVFQVGANDGTRAHGGATATRSQQEKASLPEAAKRGKRASKPPAETIASVSRDDIAFVADLGALAHQLALPEVSELFEGLAHQLISVQQHV